MWYLTLQPLEKGANIILYNSGQHNISFMAPSVIVYDISTFWVRPVIFSLLPLFIECCERPKAFKKKKDLFGIVQNYLYAVVLWDRMGSYALCSLFRIVSNSVMACTGLWSFQGKKLSSSGRWKRCLVKLRRLCYTIRREFVECSARDGKDVICGSC